MKEFTIYEIAFCNCLETPGTLISNPSIYFRLKRHEEEKKIRYFRIFGTFRSCSLLKVSHSKVLVDEMSTNSK